MNLHRLLATAMLSISAGTSSAQINWSVEFVGPTHCDDRGCSLALGPSGSVHALYFHDNTTGGRGLLWYSRRAPAGGWGSPIDVAGSASHVASLALGPGEVPFAAYSNGADQTERVRSLGGSSFADFGPPLASGDFWKGGQGGAVLVDSSGRPSLAHFYGYTEDARFSAWNGASWSTVAVETGPRVGKGMRATWLSDGRPAIAYYDQDGNRVRYAERAVGGAWTLGPTFPMTLASDLDALPNGGAVLMLRLADPGPMYVYQRVGGAWSVDATFPGAAFKHGQAFVDGSGGVHVVGVDQQGRVDYLRRVGAAWQVHPVATGAQGGRQADLVVTAAGEPMIAFTRIADDAFVLLRGNGTSTPPVISAITPDGGRASGGTPITITGQNFVAGATSVTIGGVPAAITNVTPTSVTCVSPHMSAVGPQSVQLTTPAGSTATIGASSAVFWSSYRLQAYGQATSGTGGAEPTLDADFANSTPQVLRLAVSNALPSAQGALAGDYHHIGLPMPFYGLTLNVYPSWFQTMPLVAFAALFSATPTMVTSKLANHLLAGPDGLPFQTDTQGRAGVDVAMWPHFELPTGPTTLSFQAFVTDPEGEQWRRNETIGIALNAAVAAHAGPLAGGGGFVLSGSLYALDQWFTVTGADGAALTSVIFQRIVGIIRTVPQLALALVPTVVSVILNSSFPNTTYAATEGLEVTYFGP